MSLLSRPQLHVRYLGCREYLPVWHAMQVFTDVRDARTADELWLLEHAPVFTLGQAGRSEHLIADPGGVPVLDVDRGGQVTYHGPGQVVAYTLIDLRRRGLGVRALVSALERAVIALLHGYGIEAAARRNAPGVYVDGRKIAALGLRIRRGCAYHGLSLNVAMDLAPFACIDPCGYPGLAVTQTRDLGVSATPAELARRLVDELAGELGYNPRASAAQLPDIGNRVSARHRSESNP